MCYEIISYLTQRARNHKKKKKKTIHTPTLTLRKASSISKVFKDAVLYLLFWQFQTGAFLRDGLFMRVEVF